MPTSRNKNTPIKTTPTSSSNSSTNTPKPKVPTIICQSRTNFIPFWSTIPACSRTPSFRKSCSQSSNLANPSSAVLNCKTFLTQFLAGLQEHQERSHKEVVDHLVDRPHRAGKQDLDVQQLRRKLPYTVGRAVLQ